MTGKIVQQASLKPEHSIYSVSNVRYIIFVPDRASYAQYGVILIGSSNNLNYLFCNGKSSTTVRTLNGNAISYSNVGDKFILDTGWQYTHTLVLVGGQLASHYKVTWSNTIPTS